MKTAIVAYVPVLHAGYIRLFRKYPDSLYILGQDFITELPRLERDIRALTSEEARAAVEALGIFSEVKVLDKKNVMVLAKTAAVTFIMPDEDILHTVAEKY